ncbi:hypothetical protein XELAEV_18022087mg [Xenopus laevis]|uniref:Mucin-2 n=1 Tax=Xenopus laevis TaxID=8355 RepID=A0A974D1M1_XENLA|nr:hypothetical protein XELAEV_18022087mg [Xenopus laevis]
MGDNIASLFLLLLALTLTSAYEVKTGRIRNHGNYVCSTWGNFHYKTFDGDFYQFPGLCSYELASHCGGPYSEFSVHVKHTDTTGHPLIEKIIVTVKDVIIQLKRNLVVVNGQIAKTPYYSYGILLHSNDAYIKLYTKTGLTLMWNKEDAIMVELDPKFNNQTCGLCGDYNGVPFYNEFISGGIHLTPLQFGNLQNVYDPFEHCTNPDETQIADTSQCSQYRSVCEEHLTHPAFADCQSLLKTESFIQACMLDMCSCGQSQDAFCLCSTISEFSRQCSHAGGRPGIWRTETFCSKTCPGNMIYQESGSPCTSSCSHLEIHSLCEEHYMDGCFCPEGTVLDDHTGKGCVPLSECSCKHQGALYSPGATIQNDCNECNCNAGKWKCTNRHCPRVCSIEGGAHFNTFDGKKYTFHGNCYYVLLKGERNESHALLGELTPCSSSPRETCLKTIKMLTDNMQNVVTFNADRTVLLNELEISLPHVTASFSILQPTESYIIVQSSFGIELQIQLLSKTPMMQLFINMDRPITKGLKGLCGNFNYMEGDDFKTSGGLVEATASAFANTWKANPTCPDQNEYLDDPCSLNIESQSYGNHWCTQLEKPESPFAKCHSTVDPGDYIKRCQYDVCNCKDSEACMCAVFSSYVRACAAKGIILWGWRSGICEGDVKSCPSTQMYLYNLTTCQPTCRSLAEGDKACSSEFTPVDGCGCPDGEYLNEKDQCVPISQCSCYYQATYIRPQEVISKQNEERCSCHNGRLICTTSTGEKSCPKGKIYNDCNKIPADGRVTPVHRSCKTLTVDYFQTECRSGCVCPDGLLDDGMDNCVTEDKCSCMHNQEYHHHGEEIKVDCNTCTCRSGTWYCTNVMCFGTCTVYGSGHYITFDNKIYDFDGNCEYVAAQDYCGQHQSQGNFSVITENVPCGTTGVTCSKSIKVFLGSTELKLTEQHVIETLGDAERRVNYISREVGLYLVIEARNGILLIWDKSTTILIKASPAYKGTVCGLCGNFDDKSNNDFTTSHLMQVNNVMEFGNSWKVDAKCPDVTQDIHPCTLTPHRKAWAEKQCGLIISEAFEKCHSKVDPTPFYESCVNDACSCDSGGDCKCFCTAVAIYAQECNEAGACVNWRTPDLCPVFCDYYNPKDECQWHYYPCGFQPYKTCLSINNCFTNETVTYLEGCYPSCPPDKPIFDEIKKLCVAESQCGCYINCIHYEFGVLVPTPEPCQSCICGSDSNVSCHFNQSACVCVINGTTYEEGASISNHTQSGICIEVKCINGTAQPHITICPTTQSTSIPTTSITTTPKGSTSTACVAGWVCNWSQWYDVSKPQEGLDSGDFETYEEIKRHGFTICEKPEDIQCRAVSAPDVSLDQIGQTVHCNSSYGFICRNSEQNQDASFWQRCYNYEIRVSCCVWDCLTATTTSTTVVTTTTERTTPPTTTESTTTGSSTTTFHEPTTTSSTSTPPSSTTTTLLSSTTNGTPTTSTTTPIFTTTPTETSSSPTSTSTSTTTTTSVTTTPPTPSPPTQGTSSPTSTQTSSATTSVTTTPTPSPTTSTTTSIFTTTPTETSSSPTSTSTSTTTTSSVTTTPPTPSCLPICKWTKWFDVSYPTYQNGGDFETYENIRKAQEEICEIPLNISCRAEKFPDKPLDQVGQIVTCDVSVGLRCYNKDQSLIPVCHNYEISVYCCEPSCTSTTTTLTSTSPPSSTTSTTQPPSSTTILTLPTSTTLETTTTPLSTTTSGTIHTESTTVSTTTLPTTTLETSTSLTTTPHTIPTSTTQGTTTPLPTTTEICPPICKWTEWFDVSYPVYEPNGGDYETYENISKAGHEICKKPLNISCRAERFPDKPLDQVGQIVTCDVSVGLICNNKDQTTGFMPVCYNYEISVYCCEPDPSCTTTSIHTTTTTSTSLPSSTTSTTQPPSTTTTTTATIPTSTTLETTTRLPTTTSSITTSITPSVCPPICRWTEWFDVFYPKYEPNGGDYETYDNIRKAGHEICEKPLNISCRAERFPDKPLDQMGQIVTCDVSVGLICNNKDQTTGFMPVCYNYEISVYCCEPDPSCTTTTTHTTTSTTTSTSTSPPSSTTSTTQPPTYTPSETPTTISPTTTPISITTTTHTPSISSTTTTVSPTTTTYTPAETSTTISPTTTPISTTTTTHTPSETTTTISPTTTTISPTTTTTVSSTTTTISPTTTTYTPSETSTTISPTTTTTVSSTTTTISPTTTTRTPSETTTATISPTTTTNTPSETSTTISPTTTPISTTTTTHTPSETTTTIYSTTTTISPTTTTNTPSETSTSISPTTTPISTTTTTHTPSETTTATISPTTTTHTPSETSTTISPTTTPISTTTPTYIPSETTTTIYSTTTIISPTTTTNTPSETSTTISPTTTPIFTTTTTHTPSETTTTIYSTTTTISPTTTTNTPSETSTSISPTTTPISTTTTTHTPSETTTNISPTTTPISTTTTTHIPSETTTTIYSTTTTISPTTTTNTPSETSTTIYPTTTPIFTTTTTHTPSETTTTIYSTTTSISPTTTTNTPSETSTSISPTTTPISPTTTTNTPSETSTSISPTTTPISPTTTTPISPTTTTHTPSETSTNISPTTTPISTTTTTHIPSETTTTIYSTTTTISPTTTTNTPSETSTTISPTTTPIFTTTTTHTPSETTTTIYSTTTSISPTTTTNTPSETSTSISPTTTPISTTTTTHTPSETTTATIFPTTTTHTPSETSTTISPTTTPIFTTTTTHIPSETTTTIYSTTTTISPTTTTYTPSETTTSTISPTTTLHPPSETTTIYTPTEITTTSTAQTTSSPSETSTSSVISTPCLCLYSGATYHPGEEITSGVVNGTWCYRVICSAECEAKLENWICGSTTTPTTPTTTPFTTTSETISTSQSTTPESTTVISTTTSPLSSTTNSSTTKSTSVKSTTTSIASTTKTGCPFDPYREHNETWMLCNCTMARCLENNVVEVIQLKCEPPPMITCANGRPPIAVPDDDLCCWHWECDCVCSGWGDPHYVTFDGTYYSYQGNCTYVLVEEIEKKVDNFGIYIDNYYCDDRDRVSCPRNIIVRHESQEIQILAKTLTPLSLEVLVNGEIVGVPYKKYGVKIYTSGINYVVEIPELKTNITFNGMSFSVKLPHNLFGGNTQGQCGTCTNNRADDCMMRNHTITSNCEAMADTWIVHDPRKPECITKPLPPLTTPSTSCKPSALCELIKSQAFKECHNKLNPEDFYQACIFDSCHVPHSNIECTSLQQYALLCGDQGICVEWRSQAPGCAISCPANKVYKPCASVATQTCQTTPEEDALMKEDKRLVEGCFCPQGTMPFSTENDVCVSSCGCVGPDNIPRKYGEMFQLDCQDCVCREGGSGIFCQTHFCKDTKNTKTCDLEGFVAVIQPSSTDKCCNETICRCDTSQCSNASPNCGLGYEMVGSIPEGHCCPIYQCVRKQVCVHANAEYLPGSPVYSDKCQTCVCGNSSTGLEIQCQRVACNVQCPPGFTLKESKQDCCGVCEQTHCVLNYDGVYQLLNPGDTVPARNDNCTVYSCTMIRKQFISSVSQISCPPFYQDDCEPGTIQFLPNGCCKICIQKSTSCKLQPFFDYLFHNNCRSLQPVKMSRCEGTCDTFSMYSAKAGSISHKCTCCQEVLTSQKSVKLQCSDGDVVDHQYIDVEECNCMNTECGPVQSQDSELNVRSRRSLRKRRQLHGGD